MQKMILSLILIAAISGCTTVPAVPQPTVTLVHITDVHLRNRFNADQRLRLAFTDIRSKNPNLVINTGDTLDGPSDTIDRSFDAPWKWQTWKTVSSEELKGIPLYNLFGNHDLDRPLTREQTSVELKMPAPYYHFDQAGWRFIMLDGNGFEKDQKQWDWLVKTLEETPKTVPIAIASHHPIFSAGAMVHSPGDHIGRWKDLIALFSKHPNVKLSLCGHSHLACSTRYNGVTYADGGSVSGYWWEIKASSDGKGRYHETPPGYDLIRLSASDVISVDYVQYPDPYIEKLGAKDAK